MTNNGSFNFIKLFPTAEFLSYWDELSLLIACLLLLIRTARKKFKKDDRKYLLLMIGAVAIGLIGNIIFEYQNSSSAIIRDILEISIIIVYFL